MQDDKGAKGRGMTKRLKSRIDYYNSKESSVKYDKNYFEIFELDTQFDLDQALVNEKYFKIINKINISSADLDMTISQINEAYNVLKNDLSRAEYLLMLSNISLSETTVLDSIFIEQILETLESVESAKNKNTLLLIKQETLSKKNLLIQDLKNAFLNNDLRGALDITTSIKYIQNLLNSIKIKLQDATLSN